MKIYIFCMVRVDRENDIPGYDFFFFYFDVLHDGPFSNTLYMNRDKDTACAANAFT